MWLGHPFLSLLLLLLSFFKWATTTEGIGMESNALQELRNDSYWVFFLNVLLTLVH